MITHSCSVAADTFELIGISLDVHLLSLFNIILISPFDSHLINHSYNCTFLLLCLKYIILEMLKILYFTFLRDINIESFASGLILDKLYSN